MYNNTIFDANQEKPLFFNAFVLKKLTYSKNNVKINNNAQVWFLNVYNIERNDFI